MNKQLLIMSLILPSEYKEIIRENGHSLKSMGYNGFGLVRSFALKAIKTLENTNISIVGGDVLILINNKISFTSTYDNWYCEKKDKETLNEYIERSKNITYNYIINYKEPENGKILYCLILEEYSKLLLSLCLQRLF